MERKQFTFPSNAKRVELLSKFDERVVKNEPMFFNSTVSYALSNGGSITKEFLEKFIRLYPTKHGEAVFDSRVHMLMPGWYPAIPGFHHDDVVRSRSDGQPEYRDYVNRGAMHVMGLVNGRICPTEFAVGTVTLDEVLPGEGPVYKTWHYEVEQHIAMGTLKRHYVWDHAMVEFSTDAFHQAVPALEGGWRWFGRVSWNTLRKPTNEIRRQVQVYLEHPMEGW